MSRRDRMRSGDILTARTPAGHSSSCQGVPASDWKLHACDPHVHMTVVRFGLPLLSRSHRRTVLLRVGRPAARRAALSHRCTCQGGVQRERSSRRQVSVAPVVVSCVPCAAAVACPALTTTRRRAAAPERRSSCNGATDDRTRMPPLHRGRDATSHHSRIRRFVPHRVLSPLGVVPRAWRRGATGRARRTGCVAGSSSSSTPGERTCPSPASTHSRPNTIYWSPLLWRSSFTCSSSRIPDAACDRGVRSRSGSCKEERFALSAGPAR
jgi:hypothetical protein